MKKKEETEKGAVKAQAALERVKGVRKYLMEYGICKIVAKIFASDEYVFEMVGFVPKL